jgi:hypothetical protein
MKTWFVLSLLRALSRGENVCGVPSWKTTTNGVKAVLVGMVVTGQPFADVSSDIPSFPRQFNYFTAFLTQH